MSEAEPDPRELDLAAENPTPVEEVQDFNYALHELVVPIEADTN